MSASDFKMWTATEVFYHAFLGAEGSGLIEALMGSSVGTPWDAIATLVKHIHLPETPALPAPRSSRRGTAKLPERRSGQR